MLRKFSSTTRQILNHICRHQVMVTEKTLLNSLPRNFNLGRCASHSLRSTKSYGFQFGSILRRFRLESLSDIINSSQFSCRFVSCKKVKDKKGKGRKSQICSKAKKGLTIAECPETPCRCPMPKELNTPSRVRMDRSKRDKPQANKQDSKNKNCVSDECDNG